MEPSALNLQGQDLENFYGNVTQNFAKQMRNVLLKSNNKKKTHWSFLPNCYMLSRIKEETHEIEEALLNQEKIDLIIKECVDVANFCMMLADNLKSKDKNISQ